MNTFGLIIGFMTLIIIGLGFVWVIFGERYFSYRWWPFVIVLGLILVGLSTLIANDYLSAIVGIIGASFIWGATELKDQAIRSELGWFKYRGNKIRAPFEQAREMGSGKDQ